ncbi:MAG: hypothetical protein H7A48_02205 [Akkermansiaceae bacterium]|nr:hypothetical protein [Akkermansiaceae bacterium]
MNNPSIRRSLLLRTGIGVGLLLCILSAVTYLLVRRGLYQQLDNSIQQTAALLANQVELEDGHITFEWSEGIGTNPLATDEGLFQYWNETTGQTTRSPALGGGDLPKFRGPNGTPELRDIHMPGRRRHARALGMVVYPFVLPEEQERMAAENRVLDPKSMPHVLVVARDAKPVHRILTRLRWILGAGTLGTLVIGYLLIERAVRVSLKPIDQLARRIRRRTARNFGEGIKLPGKLPEELVGVAEDFDSLLTRVAATRNRERDFIRHAAHELRTPIAGLQATTELALSKPRDAAGYAAHLETCRKTSAELAALVKRLSALARIDARTSAPEPSTVDLSALTAECLKPFRTTIEAREIRLESETPDPPPLASADPTLARVVINNLLDNAVSYGAFPGVLRIRFRRQGENIVMAVANPVDGFPDDPGRLFEPLFRRDESRHDSGTHLGIGLTLSQEAAEAMHGSLKVRKTRAGWIEFQLSLPVPPP